MKLHFLGRSYFKSHSRLETVPLDRTACYRGQKYQLRAPATNLATSGDKPTASLPLRAGLSISIRKYRGVSYIVEHQNPAPPKQREFCHQ